jgi:hypothetical protein
MSNMSYCRFENTVSDLADCVEVMNECNFDPEQLKEKLSPDEFKSYLRMVCIAREISANTPEEE